MDESETCEGCGLPLWARDEDHFHRVMGRAALEMQERSVRGVLALLAPDPYQILGVWFETAMRHGLPARGFTGRVLAAFETWRELEARALAALAAQLAHDDLDVAARAAQGKYDA
jgi:hypothetical protein